MTPPAAVLSMDLHFARYGEDEAFGRARGRRIITKCGFIEHLPRVGTGARAMARRLQRVWSVSARSHHHQSVCGQPVDWSFCAKLKEY